MRLSPLSPYSVPRVEDDVPKPLRPPIPDLIAFDRSQACQEARIGRTSSDERPTTSQGIESLIRAARVVASMNRSGKSSLASAKAIQGKWALQRTAMAASRSR